MHKGRIVKSLSLSAAAMSVVLSGCASTQVSLAEDTRTEFQRALDNCPAIIFAGALVGAVVGNNTGDRRTSTGVKTGATVGAVVCGIMLASAHERDNILAQERRAAQTSKSQSYAYKMDDGKTALAKTEVKPIAVPGNIRPVAMPQSTFVAAPPSAPTTCRQVSTTIETQGGNAPLPTQIYCRTANGDYEPYTPIVASNGSRA